MDRSGTSVIARSYVGSIVRGLIEACWLNGSGACGITKSCIGSEIMGIFERKCFGWSCAKKAF